MRRPFLLFLGIVGFFISCGSPHQTEPVDIGTTNTGSPGAVAPPYPNARGQDFQSDKNFANLLNNYLEGKIYPTPWAGFWWPYSSNGIAAGTYGRGYSPTGKYDAARGGTTHATEWEVKNHGVMVPKLQGWWGHCNGWCAASVLFPEPHEPVKVNGVTFSVGDIKALLTEVGMEASADFYGNRVDYYQDYYSPKYWDVVPDQYFLILTHYIGKLRQGVLIDRFTGDQVWNQPLAGYRFEYPKKEDYLGVDPQAPNVYRILVTSTIWWLRDDVVADVQTPPFNFEDSDIYQSRILKMEVWLDAPVEFNRDGKIKSSGNVIVTRQGEYIAGGAWRMGEGIWNDAWPDYMWVPYSILKPTEYANNQVDVEWIKTHILSGGVDDPSVRPAPLTPAPEPHPWPSVFPRPNPTSTHWPEHRPTPTPAPTVPIPAPSLPTPEPTRSPRPHR